MGLGISSWPDRTCTPPQYTRQKRSRFSPYKLVSLSPSDLAPKNTEQGCKKMEVKEEQSTKRKKQKQGRFWTWVAASVLFRLILIYFPKNLNLSSRPEVSTPLTSLRRRNLSLKLGQNHTFSSFGFYNSLLFFFFQWLRVTGWSSRQCLPMQVSHCWLSILYNSCLIFQRL